MSYLLSKFYYSLSNYYISLHHFEGKTLGFLIHFLHLLQLRLTITASRLIMC